jgi:hypothetical protein
MVSEAVVSAARQAEWFTWTHLEIGAHDASPKEIRDSGCGIRDAGFGMRDSGCGIRDEG